MPKILINREHDKDGLRKKKDASTVWRHPSLNSIHRMLILFPADRLLLFTHLMGQYCIRQDIPHIGLQFVF
jgi:hypothetical protein